jgi:thiosulfate/3-mercaptopyruvate sulfurtransferase
VPPRPWPDRRLAGIDDVAGADDVLIDGRDAERFAGGPDPVDPRAGHIPGARSFPAAANLAPDGHLLPPEELRDRFRNAGIDGRQPVISYCGSGVAACFNLLAMERAGLPPGRLYPGSWSQWSRDPERPLQTGSGRGVGES